MTKSFYPSSRDYRHASLDVWAISRGNTFTASPLCSPWPLAPQPMAISPGNIWFLTHPTISSSVVPFSSHPQSFPASGSFQMSQLFASGSQSFGASSSVLILPVNVLSCMVVYFLFSNFMIFCFFKTALFFPYSLICDSKSWSILLLSGDIWQWLETFFGYHN